MAKTVASFVVSFWLDYANSLLFWHPTEKH